MSQTPETETPTAPRRRSPPRQVPAAAKTNGEGRSFGFARLSHSPSMTISRRGKPPIKLATDRVRARPAVSSSLAMNLGIGAIGLGFWGMFAPKSVARTFGLDASPATVRGLFGLRELVTGYGLAGDPTKYGLLWARVVGDIFDLAVLSAANHPGNPKAANARFALKAVAVIGVLDLVSAVRQSTVQRNCIQGSAR